jgi:hypothetical protein
MSFVLKGSQKPFTYKVASNLRRQSKNIEMKYKTHIKLALESYSRAQHVALCSLVENVAVRRKERCRHVAVAVVIAETKGHMI